MPLIVDEKPANHSRLLLWSVEEPLSWLIQKACLNNNDFKKLESFKSLTRKKEWVTSRMIIREFVGEEYIVSYDNRGKPLLNERNDISISHTSGMVGVLIDWKHIPGMDVQEIKPKINELSSRFMNENEFIVVKQNKNFSKLEWMTIFWACKESLYKMCNSNQIEFKTDFNIIPTFFSEKNFKLEGKTSLLHGNFNYLFQGRIVNNTVLIHSLHPLI